MILGAAWRTMCRLQLTILLCLITGLSSCARTVPPTKPSKAVPLRVPEDVVHEGMASWYGPGFHGKTTTSGETYDMYQLTAAHPTLPMGTMLEVTNLENDRTVQVRVNDRGPFVKDRILDLSYAAARVVDMVKKGTARVRLEIINGSKEGKRSHFSLRPHYVLQLGAFTQRENALSLQRELQNLLWRDGVEVVPGRLGSQTIFRVRTGMYTHWDEAKAKAEELAQKGYVVLVVEEYE